MKSRLPANPRPWFTIPAIRNGLTGIALSTVRDMILRFERSGVSWPVPSEISDAELEVRLYDTTGVQPGRCKLPEPGWSAVSRKMKRKHMTCRSCGRSVLPETTRMPVLSRKNKVITDSHPHATWHLDVAADWLDGDCVAPALNQKWSGDRFGYMQAQHCSGHGFMITVWQYPQTASVATHCTGPPL